MLDAASSGLWNRGTSVLAQRVDVSDEAQVIGGFTDAVARSRRFMAHRWPSRTPRARVRGEEEREVLGNTTYRTPIRRWGVPADYRVLGAYLADPTQVCHTGDEVVMDGGSTRF